MDAIFKTLQIDRKSNYWLVTLNRPEVMNAINIDMMNDLCVLWRYLYVPPKNLRCVILTGSGQKAFCAGADLKERNHLSTSNWQKQHAILQQAMLAMIDCSIPIISAVNGVAFGGGLELVLASDFAYATHTASFAQSETRWGIMPGAMGTQHLPRACGLRRAKELCYTASVFSAQQAYDWGVINQLCEPDNLISDVVLVAEKIADNAPIAIRKAKKAMDMSKHLDLKSGYSYEVEVYQQLLTTKDREEGISAFNEKRKPYFRGE